MSKFLCIILAISCLTVNVFATNSLQDLIDNVNENIDIPLNFDDDVVAADIEDDILINEDNFVEYSAEYNQIITFDSAPLAYDLSNLSVYNGSWSGSTLDYFTGIVLKYPNTDYVIFRASSSTYYCIYGDIELTNGYFVGTGLNYIQYETSSYNNPTLTRNVGDLRLPAQGFIYSNLGDFASVTGQNEVLWLETFSFTLVVLIGYFMLNHIINFR